MTLPEALAAADQQVGDPFGNQALITLADAVRARDQWVAEAERRIAELERRAVAVPAAPAPAAPLKLW